MPDIPEHLKPVLADLILTIADDKLILGHRNSDWTGLAPMLEEDIAFSSLAQDQIAHAQALYEFISEHVGRSADQLAFGREPRDYRCASIVEIPDEFDWATAIARQMFCTHFDLLRLGRLANSKLQPLAALAARLRAEQHVHVEHIGGWIHRLGQGTDDSRERLQQAVEALTPHACMLFEPITGQDSVETSGYYPPADRDMFEQWSDILNSLAADAGLTLNLERPVPDEIGGRRGKHTEHLKELLDEMCEVFRLEPDAAW